MDLSPTVRIYHWYTVHICDYYMYNWGYTISRNWGYTIDITYSEDIPLVAILGVCFPLNVISIIGLTGKWLEHPTERADIVVPGASAENIEAELRYLWGALRTIAGWWFQPLWTILVSWGYYSQYIWKNQKCSKPPTNYEEMIKSYTQMLHGAGIFTNIYPQNHSNVATYTMHGAYGLWPYCL